jgi:two-component system response regulator (stage 0 sporulation protein A)
MDDTRVLIVEDNSDLRKLMIDFLDKQVGISVLGEASNGVEALDFQARNEVDLILLDIIMPQMDGFKMLEKMRSNDIRSCPNVIVVSSLARKEFIKRAYDLGVIHYLVKPFGTDELLYHIRKVNTLHTAVV